MIFVLKGLFVGLGVSILLITTRDQKIEIVRMAKFKEKSPFIDEDLIKINVFKIILSTSSSF